MIVGIGIDVVDIKRFSRSIERWGDRFLRRILTPAEISFCRRKATSDESMAARFAAKEALFKCLQPNLQTRFRWKNIEIVNDKSGRPQLFFSGGLKKSTRDFLTHLSITHMGDIAIAIVVMEKKENT